jgi:hypothetical protein
MSSTKIHTGYVITDTGTILLQIPDNNRWGFSIQDDDQTWPGGLGIASEWEVLKDTDPRITDADRERLQWILDEVEA